MKEISMTIELDFHSNEPIYSQVARQVETRVVKGSLSSGVQLPTVRKMAADLRINFNTVARAYRILDEAGLISTQRGRGTFILGKPSEESVSQLPHCGLEGLALKLYSDAARLGFTPEEVLHYLGEHACQKDDLDTGVMFLAAP